jgi:sugar phosphate permease
MAFLLGAGVVITYFDRINLSVSREALQASFGVSLVGFGYLSSAFSWTYGAMQIPAGILLDRYGVKRISRIGTFLWGCASFAAAASIGMTSMFAARMLLGVAESPVFPANAKAIGNWFPPHERSFPMAITDGAAKFASAIGVPLIGLTLLHFGWRIAFGATALVSLVYSGLFFLFYRNPSEDSGLTVEERDYILSGASSASTDLKKKRSVLSLLGERKVWGLALGWGAYNYGFYMLLTWLPSYLSLALHLDLLHSVVYTSIPWLFATFADVFIGGWLVDALIRRGWSANRVRKTALVAGMSLGLAIWGARTVQAAPQALLWISIALCGLSIAAPVAWTVPSLIAAEENVAVVGAIANVWSQIAGISAPIVTGYIVSVTHSFSYAFAAVTAVLIVGICGYTLLLGRIEPMRST